MKTYQLPENPAGSFLMCDSCGTRYTALRSDYFAHPPDLEIRCACEGCDGRPLILGRTVTYDVPVNSGDEATVVIAHEVAPTSALELVRAYVGRRFFYTVDSLTFPIRIIDARMSYGASQVKVTPAADGSGSKWIAVSSLGREITR